MIETYGFKVVLVGQMLTSMHGSGELHAAYIYKRACPFAAAPRGERRMTIPKRAGFNEQDVEVSCDPSFVVWCIRHIPAS